MARDIRENIFAAAKYYGIDPYYMLSKAGIESRFNPNARHPKSGASGLYQFVPRTWQQYGKGKNVFDSYANIDAAARLTRDNHDAFVDANGRKPTSGELYLMHQQGAAGTQRLLDNPDAPAYKVIGYNKVKQNLPKEIRHLARQLTSQEFADYWKDKAEAGIAKYRGDPNRPPAEVPQVAGGQQSPTATTSKKTQTLSDTPTLSELQAPKPQAPYNSNSKFVLRFPSMEGEPNVQIGTGATPTITPTETPKAPAAQAQVQSPTETPAPLGLPEPRIATMAPNVRAPKPKLAATPGSGVYDLLKRMQAGEDVSKELGIPAEQLAKYDLRGVDDATLRAAATQLERQFPNAGKRGGVTPTRSPSETIVDNSIKQSDGASPGFVADNGLASRKPIKTVNAKKDAQPVQSRGTLGNDDMPGTPSSFGGPGATYLDYVNRELNKNPAARAKNLPATQGGSRAVVPREENLPVPRQENLPANVPPPRAPLGGSPMAASVTAAGAVGAAGLSPDRPQDETVPPQSGTPIPRGTNVPRPTGADTGTDPNTYDEHQQAAIAAREAVAQRMRNQVRRPNVGTGPRVAGIGDLPGPGYTTDPDEAARRRAARAGVSGGAATGDMGAGKDIAEQMIERVLGIPPGTLQTPQGQQAMANVRQMIEQNPEEAKAVVGGVARKDAARADAQRNARPTSATLPQGPRGGYPDYGGSPTTASDRMSDMAAMNGPGMNTLMQFFTGGGGSEQQ